MPEEHPNIYAALLAAQMDVKTLAKDATNDYHKYNYLSATAVELEARRVLHANGLFVTCQYQVMCPIDIDKPVVTCHLRCFHETCLQDPQTHMIYDITTAMHAMDKGDKGIAKAQTGSRKYALMNLLAIPSTDDPEGDSSVDKDVEIKSTPVAKPATPKPPQQIQREAAATVGDSLPKFINAEPHPEGNPWYTMPITYCMLKERGQSVAGSFSFDTSGIDLPDRSENKHQRNESNDADGAWLEENSMSEFSKERH